MHGRTRTAGRIIVANKRSLIEPILSSSPHRLPLIGPSAPCSLCPAPPHSTVAGALAITSQHTSPTKQMKENAKFISLMYISSELLATFGAQLPPSIRQQPKSSQVEILLYGTTAEPHEYILGKRLVFFTREVRRPRPRQTLPAARVPKQHATAATLY